ncbi:hypothetical protein HZA97_09375 [Candidatus Woesearchaeota archaeon]|nr:hypothetical protein [Candidatus Woesearchaeota archaeon]
MYKQKHNLIKLLGKYVPHIVLGAAMSIGCYSAQKAIIKTSVEQTEKKEEMLHGKEIPHSTLLQDNAPDNTLSAQIEWLVRYIQTINQSYCPGHSKRIRRIWGNDHKIEYCGGCQTRQINTLEEKIYTANSFQELTRKVCDDLSGKGIEQKAFEATALLAVNKTEVNDKIARVNIISTVDNVNDTDYTSLTKSVMIETNKGVGVYSVCQIKKGKEEESRLVKEINKVDLPEASTVDCLSDMAQSIACESSLAVIQTMFEYAKGEEKISPVKPGFDFLKNITAKTGENLFDRYSPEEVKAVVDLISYAKTAEEFYDAVSNNTNLLDLSIAIKTLGLEKVLDALEEKVTAQLDAQCENIAEQTKQSCSQAFNSLMQKKTEQTTSTLQNIQNQEDLGNIPAKRENVGEYKLNTKESVSDWFRSRGLQSDFGTRKPIYERTHPGEKYQGSAEQNEKWVRELNNSSNNGSDSRTESRTESRTVERKEPPGAGPSIEQDRQRAIERDMERDREMHMQRERAENERQNREQEQRARGGASRPGSPPRPF